MILGSKINTKIIEQYLQSTEIKQPLALNSAVIIQNMDQIKRFSRESLKEVIALSSLLRDLTKELLFQSKRD